MKHRNANSSINLHEQTGLSTGSVTDNNQLASDLSHCCLGEVDD
jgi:hypothetical protein